MQPLHWLLANSMPKQITCHQLYQYLSRLHFWLIPSVSLSSPFKLLCSKTTEFSVLSAFTNNTTNDFSLPQCFCSPVQVVYCYIYLTVLKFCSIHFDCVNVWYWLLLMIITIEIIICLLPCTFDCTVCSLNSETWIC